MFVPALRIAFGKALPLPGKHKFHSSHGLILALLVFALAGIERGHAQAVWGSITGYVTDPSGSAVPQATVTITAEDTGIETTVEADAAGFYNGTHLSPGQY